MGRRTSDVAPLLLSGLLVALLGATAARAEDAVCASPYAQQQCHSIDYGDLPRAATELLTASGCDADAAGLRDYGIVVDLADEPAPLYKVCCHRDRDQPCRSVLMGAEAGRWRILSDELSLAGFHADHACNELIVLAHTSGGHHDLYLPYAATTEIRAVPRPEILAFAAGRYAPTPPAPEIADPYAVVHDKEDGATEGMTRFFLDVNGDTLPDLFLGANANLGNGGGPFHTFLDLHGSYRDIGIVPLQPEALEILETRHFNIRDLKTCAHGGGGRYQCTTYAFDGRQFRAACGNDISAAQFPSAIRPTAVTIERSSSSSTWPGPQP